MAGNEAAATPADDKRLLADAARRAGVLALSFFNGSNEVWMKPGNSPVSQADIAVNEFLKSELCSARPGYAWLSEESPMPEQFAAETPVFVVDPIDGTRGFIDGNRDWAISIAVVKSGMTIAAALCVPAKDRLFEAVRGGGAFLNSAPLSCPEPQLPLIFAGSRKLEHEMQILGLPVKAHVPSLACRIAMVATGEVSAVMARQGSHVWDVAAAVLILEEAGGGVVRRDGAPLRNTLSPPTAPAFVAAGKGILPEALSLAKKHSFLQ